MAKGFGKKQGKGDEIFVESMVASRTLTPAVQIAWGKEKAQLSPETARHHAFCVLEALAAAEYRCLLNAVGNPEIRIIVARSRTAPHGVSPQARNREDSQLHYEFRR